MNVGNPNVNNHSFRDALKESVDYIYENPYKLLMATGLTGSGLYLSGGVLKSAITALTQPSIGSISFLGGTRPLGILELTGAYICSRIAGTAVKATAEPLLAFKHSLKNAKNSFLSYVGDDKEKYDQKRINEMLEKAISRKKETYNLNRLKGQVVKSKQRNPLNHYDEKIINGMIQSGILNYTYLEQIIATGKDQDTLYQELVAGGITVTQTAFDEEIENSRQDRLKLLGKDIDFEWIEKLIAKKNSEITLQEIFNELVNAEWTGSAEFLKDKIEECRNNRFNQINSQIDFEYLSKVILGATTQYEAQRMADKIFFNLQKFGWPGTQNEFNNLINEAVSALNKKQLEEAKDANRFMSYDLLAQSLAVVSAIGVAGGLVYFYPVTIETGRIAWDSGLLTVLTIGKSIDLAVPYVLKKTSSAIESLTKKAYNVLPQAGKKLASWGWSKLKDGAGSVYRSTLNNPLPAAALTSAVAAAALYSFGLPIAGDIAVSISGLAATKSAYDWGTNL